MSRRIGYFAKAGLSSGLLRRLLINKLLIVAPRELKRRTLDCDVSRSDAGLAQRKLDQRYLWLNFLTLAWTAG